MMSFSSPGSSRPERRMYAPLSHLEDDPPPPQHDDHYAANMMSLPHPHPRPHAPFSFRRHINLMWAAIAFLLSLSVFLFFVSTLGAIIFLSVLLSLACGFTVCMKRMISSGSGSGAYAAAQAARLNTIIHAFGQNQQNLQAIPLRNLSLLLSDRDFDSNDYEQLLQLDENNVTNFARGLSPSEINRMPTTTISASDTGLLKQTCPICLERFAEGELIRTLTCLHIFHSSEIDHWLETNEQCPVCKIPIA